MMVFKQNLPLFLFLNAIFIIYCIPFLMYGMEADGIIYSILANNLAHNIGSVWKPSCMVTQWPEFYEHPPLAFYLQSLFSRLFGDSIFIDKLYFFVISLLEIIFYLLIWLINNRNLKLCFISIPLISLLLLPKVLPLYYGYIEYTLIVCVLSASYLLMRVLITRKNQIFYFLGAAALLVAGFFTNGLQAFFPLSIPFLYCCFFSKEYLKGLLQTIILTVIILGIIATIFWLQPDAFNNISNYFKQQLLASLVGNRGNDYNGFKHFYGLLYLYVLLPNLILSSLSLAFWAKIRSERIRQVFAQVYMDKRVLFFFALGLTAFVPVLLSPRQHLRYFMQSLPFFILGFAQILTPIFTKWIQKINIESKPYKITIIVSLGLNLLAIIIASNMAGKNLHKQEFYTVDARHIQKVIPAHTNISYDRDLAPWPLAFYLYRYNYNTFYKNFKEQYYVQDKTKKTCPSNYLLLNEKFQLFRLCKRE